MFAASKEIELGIASALMSATGILAINLVGIAFWGESASDPRKLIALALIIIAIGLLATASGIPHFPRSKNGEIVQQRVTDILTHPICTGPICSETYDIHWLKAQHEPLILLETFDKVQERRNGKAKAPKRKKHRRRLCASWHRGMRLL